MRLFQGLSEKVLCCYRYHPVWGLQQYASFISGNLLDEAKTYLQDEKRLHAIRQQQLTMNNAVGIVRWVYRLFNIQGYAHHYYLLAILDVTNPSKIDLKQGKTMLPSTPLPPVVGPWAFNLWATIQRSAYAIRNGIYTLYDHCRGTRPSHLAPLPEDAHPAPRTEEESEHLPTASDTSHALTRLTSPDTTPMRLPALDEEKKQFRVTIDMQDSLKILGMHVAEGVVMTWNQLQTNYRAALLRTHPDTGGSSEAVQSGNAVREVMQALKDIKACVMLQSAQRVEQTTMQNAWKIQFENNPMLAGLAGLFRDIHEMSREIITDSQNIIKTAQDAQAMARDAQAMARDAQAMARDAQAMARDVQAMARDGQAVIQRVTDLNRENSETITHIQCMMETIRTIMAQRAALGAAPSSSKPLPTPLPEIPMTTEKNEDANTPPETNAQPSMN